MRVAFRTPAVRAADSSFAVLRLATLLYAAGLVAHTADHLRRGIDVLTWEVFWAGNVSTLLGVVAIALVLMRHRLAPYAAVAIGLPIALGVAAVHLLPHWSALSDAFAGAHGTGVTPLSYTVVLVEILGALAMALSGLQTIATARRAPPVSME